MNALLTTLAVDIDADLLQRALTHKSHPDAADYERLEFLGDRVLNLCVAHLLYQTYPHYTEGQLAKHYAALVRAETLAQVAETWQLADHMRLGKSATNNNAKPQPSILADAVEALIAAIFLTGGMADAQTVITQFWTPLLDGAELQDPKSALQEFLQAAGHPVPSYKVTQSHGKDHEKHFTVQAECALGAASGTGQSKQKAARDAAKTLLLQLNKDS